MSASLSTLATSDLDPLVDARLASRQRLRTALLSAVRGHWQGWPARRFFDGIEWRLGLETVPDTIAHPYEYERAGPIVEPDEDAGDLERRLAENEGLLLLLGLPGSGKTTALLQLNDRLRERAEQDATAPVPLVATLVSWAVKRSPLEEWLGRYWFIRHGLSPREVPGLLRAREVVVLLDGLDEVPREAREVCRDEIVAFRQRYPATRVVVTCRVAEYRSLVGGWSGARACRLLPLSPGQVEDFLDASGEPLAGWRRRLETSPALREVGIVPLWLHVLAVIQSEAATESEAGAEPPAGEDHDRLLECYVRRLVSRPGTQQGGGAPPPAPHQALHWLQQMARRLRDSGEDILDLEWLSPSWLRQRWRLGWLAGVVVGVAGWGMLFAVSGPADEGARLVGIALALGIFYGFSAIVRGEPEEPLRFRFQWKNLLPALMGGLLGGAAIGLLIGLFVSLFLGLGAGMKSGLGCAGLVAVGVVLAGTFFEMKSFPQASEPLAKRRPSSWKMGVVIGLGALVGGGANFYRGGDHWGWAILAGGVAAWWFMFPNPPYRLLRWLLAWEGTLPHPLSDRRLIAWLDEMSGRGLLVRVGSGWMFFHPLLLEYLAKEPFGTTPAEVERTLGKSVTASPPDRR